MAGKAWYRVLRQRDAHVASQVCRQGVDRMWSLRMCFWYMCFLLWGFPSHRFQIVLSPWDHVLKHTSLWGHVTFKTQNKALFWLFKIHSLCGMLLSSIISCPDTILMLCAWFYCFIPVLCLNYGLSKTKSWFCSYFWSHKCLVWPGT